MEKCPVCGRPNCGFAPDNQYFKWETVSVFDAIHVVPQPRNWHTLTSDCVCNPAWGEIEPSENGRRVTRFMAVHCARYRPDRWANDRS